MGKNDNLRLLEWTHIIGGVVVLTLLAAYCLTYADAAAQVHISEGRSLAGTGALLFSLRWAMALTPVMYLWAVYVLKRRNASVMKATWIFIIGAAVYTGALVASLQ